jgi:predicted ATPase
MATMSIVTPVKIPIPQTVSGYRHNGLSLVPRSQGSVGGSMREFDPFRLDTVNQCLWRQTGGCEERVLLKPKPFAILGHLVEHAGRLVSQDELLDAVWPDTHVEPEVLKRHIFEIRNVLGDDPKSPRYIETLSRRGYLFIAPVRTAGSAVPQPVNGAAETQLVGRDQALGELQHCLGRAMKGQRQVVFVTGEAGIGKTTVVDEFESQAAGGAIRIARGQCVEGYGGTEPYYSVLEALGNLFRGPDGDSVVKALNAYAPSWLVQFPSLLRHQDREALAREIGGPTKQRMLREIAAALEIIALDMPLLLILEDLHWADTSTVDLISALARGRGSARLMVIGTYRPVDLAVSGNPLKLVVQDLLVHQLCREIALQPLDEGEIQSYLDEQSPEGPAPEGLAALLHWHSEGNPLFVVAALEHMIERRLISRQNGRWELRVPVEEIELQVPENLRAMIEIQIERWSKEELQALEAASVDGRVFSTAVSANAAGMAPERFEDLCEGLARRNLVVRSAGLVEFPDRCTSERYQFVHALYREVLYRRQSASRRAELLLRIGRLLEELYASRLPGVATELAHHFERSGNRLQATGYRPDFECRATV